MTVAPRFVTVGDFNGDGQQDLATANRDGRSGNDTLTGGTGGDRFDFRPTDGTNLITDFNLGMDLIGLADGLTFEDLTIVPVGNETLITAGELSVTLLSIETAALTSANFAPI